MLLFDIVIFVGTVVLGIIVYFKWKFSYWRNKNVPHIKPQIPFGTSENSFRKKQNSAVSFRKQYEYFKLLGYKYGGLYFLVRPGFILVDPELIKHVMTKDFHYFTDRGVYYNEKEDPLSANLFNLEGQKWRNLRAKFTPTFTTGKIKAMFPTLIECGIPLRTAISKLYEQNVPVDIKDILARYSTDVIGSCAFGLDCNSFKEPEGDFRKYGKMMFAPLSKLTAFKFLIASSNHWLGRRLGVTVMKPELKDFFLNIVKETVEYRKKNNVVRNDFMQLLINLIEDNPNEEVLTIQQIAAQAFIFFFAGFETSSATMAFCLYELAQNQTIQEKVRHEIVTVLNKHNGSITYDAIVEMKYLNIVVDETLRKYPPLGFLSRVCVQNYHVPETNLTIEKGTRVIIPSYGLHHDPEYFKNPETFNPDRFNDDNKEKIKPFTYLPFGEGPRICIGLRFGYLQTKVGLAILLKDFAYQLNLKTKTPIKFSPSSLILKTTDTILLDIKKNVIPTNVI